MQALTEEDVYRVMTPVYTTDRHCMQTIIALFKIAGIDHIFPHAKRFDKFIGRNGLTPREIAWIAKHQGWAEWYGKFRTDIYQWANEHDIVPQDAKIILQIARHLRTRILVEGELESNVVTLGDIREAIIQSADESFHDPRSLVTLKRQSRDKNESPGINIARRHSHAALALCQYLNITLDESTRRSLLPPRLHHVMIQRLRIDEQDAEDFVDEIAGADAVRALQVCKNHKESIVMLMACRLGMRRGAIHRLRMTNVAENPTNKKAPWNVKPVISGWDKGRRINEWDLRLAPGLQDFLHRYINEQWRPKYEKWDKDDKGGPKLKNGYLFPCINWSLRDKPMHDGEVRNIVRRVLERAGIRGPSAHPHACRKGFSTDLLRANNPGHVVAKALHHKSERTTFRHYDQRSRVEILSNLRVPTQWAEQANDSQPTIDEEDGQNTNGTEDNLTIIAANALENEMAMNDTMRKQLQILLASMTVEQRRTYETMCQENGIPTDVPLPT